jgi:2-polyprenyl-6-methoxyphenol hydroxylase-like FAD-dependent oxidoreductase
VRALERLGVRALLEPADCAPFVGVRYVQEDGTFAEARFAKATGGGLGVRRLALAGALSRRAVEVGVALRDRAPVRRHQRLADRVIVELDDERIEAKLLVAADGMASPLRRAAGLARPARGPRRFGLRQHFRCAPWSPFVEVHFQRGLEAYVTPAGASRVGVAFLWEDGTQAEISFASLLNQFPRLLAQLAGAPADSEPRGAGPLARGVRARTADRLVLVGDAAGYVDAITGEGLSLAFHSAELLARVLPDALVRGGSRAALAVYEREAARAFRRYALLTRGVLALSRRPWLRRRVVGLLGRAPRLFSATLGWVAKEHALAGATPEDKLLCAG